LKVGGILRAQAVTQKKILFDSGNDGLRTGFLVEIHSLSPPGHFQVVVDGETGKVSYVNDLSSSMEGEEGLTGIAAVYRTHPGDGDPEELPIAHLTRRGKLRGRDVEVSNDDMRSASGREQRFIYAPSSKHLDEAQVYFHVDRTASYFRRLGGVENVPRPLAAGVYYGEDYDNAMFLSWAPALVFGGGKRYNPLSREAAVIVHEYTHAVTYGMTQLGSLGAAGSMNEAYTDYFAAALTGDPVIGEWVVAPTGRPYMRNLLNDLRAPEDLTGESHDDSRIYSAAMWEFRQAVGGEVADRVVHESRASLNRESSFVDGLAALLEVDMLHFQGRHEAALRTAFGRHGILEGSTLW
jgi:Zn-dependent metalloprotease